MSLNFDKVSLSLNGRMLVPAFSAVVAPGQVLAVMGASGSGKSSLLAWMAGLLAPPLQASGGLSLDGRDLLPLPTEQRRVGLLFQDDLLYPNMSVLDNLLFALPAGPYAQRSALADQALARAGLSGFGGRRPNSLSGGQRARVSLLRALLAGPRAIGLDEPFSKLDVNLRQHMREFVWAELRANQVCGVLVTHDQADVPPGARVVELPALGTAVDLA